VLEKQENEQWNATMHARPLATRLEEYRGDAIARAFPLAFPYGHSGLPEDPAVAALKKASKVKALFNRNRNATLKKFLQMRSPAFHGALFTLIVFNTLMKEKIFQSSIIQAKYKRADGTGFSEAFGGLTGDQLNHAIAACRSQQPSQYGAQPAAQLLRSIEATCQAMPHTNAASMSARKIYFSYLARFALPGVFLTATPDDQSNFRIVIYALDEAQQRHLPDVELASLSDKQILSDFVIRQDCRVNAPGICAEEYRRIMSLIIKHIFQWNEEDQKSTGQGCFGILDAWCLATEEQGRKTLHGHALLFVHGWNDLLRKAQSELTPPQERTVLRAQVTRFCSSICSAQLFQDFEKPMGVLSDHAVFKHEGCRDSKHPKRQRYTCVGVPDQQLREMRHKRKCHEHDGHIATCPRCDHKVTVHDIVTTAMQCHLGKSISYPDHNRRLDRYVYNTQMEDQWYTKDNACKRYFAGNAKANLHYTTHANRCFAKGHECYANLPDMPQENSTLVFADKPDLWYDAQGNYEPRYMFRFYPKRNLEDAFMNTHSPVLSLLFPGFNTNVLCGMSGSAVFYVTGYNAKMQQKDEQLAYGNVAICLGKVIENQLDADEPLPPHQQGFRRLLAGVYAHTHAHIVAAPMAHYLALHDSRFRYSHGHTQLPVFGMENYVLEQATLMTFRNVDGRQVPFHKSMDYLFRPTEQEALCAYEFAADTETMTIANADKAGREERYYLQEGHPLAQTHCVVYREKTCVPIFPWNWLESTRNFAQPLRDTVDETHAEYKQRESYCLRFLMMFYPFRTIDDMKTDSGSYQALFARQMEANNISLAMTTIADNIQNIHNSLHSTMPVNLLTEQTLEQEAQEDAETTENNRLSEMALSQIATYMASTSNEKTGLTEACRSFEPIFGAEIDIDTIPIPDFCTALEPNPTPCFETMAHRPKRKEKEDKNTGECSRFQTGTSELNTLISTILDFGDTSENRMLNATGSWQSIVQWGKKAELDPEQQTAFEILTATYVLTFHEDARQDHRALDLTEQVEMLQTLTRTNVNKPGRLRMFLTGPAGAGKCTYC
jgi:hypothetical protein